MRRLPVFVLLLFVFIFLPQQAHAQNESIIGNLCVGLDCETSELFGLDVLRLKDVNIRVHFSDASTPGNFPSNDWRITVNSTRSNGPDFFAIDDSTNGMRAFMIEDQSQDHALVISDEGGSGLDPNGGYIGIGTEDPLMELHLFHGDSPGIRMEQDGSDGFGAYTWDVAANETNFFIRDVTAGDVLPFRIYPGATNGTMTLSTDDRVGIGTTGPTSTLHLQSDDPTLRVENTSTSTDALRLNANGNLTLSGVLTEASSVHLKENFRPVDAASVLQTLGELPVQTWNYRSDNADIRHMGPMAQDFYAAFGLGIGAEHIAPLDANGVAFAAIQALLHRVQTQRDRIQAIEEDASTLRDQNAALEHRVEQLEEAVMQLLQENASE